MPDEAKTILCVDDSPASLGAWLEVLDRHGYRAIATTHPQTAISIVSCAPVHLAILDYFMPVLDGGMLAVNIRQHSSLPIVLTSNSVADVPPAVRQTVSAVVAKQDGLGALMRAVHSLLLAEAGRGER
jgi:CheY-like chemotaxis protein